MSDDFKNNPELVFIDRFYHDALYQNRKFNLNDYLTQNQVDFGNLIEDAVLKLQDGIDYVKSYGPEGKEIEEKEEKVYRKKLIMKKFDDYELKKRIERDSNDPFFNLEEAMKHHAKITSLSKSDKTELHIDKTKNDYETEFTKPSSIVKY